MASSAVDRKRQHTVFRDAPPNRQSTCDGGQEEHFPEASVMIAFALHLLDQGASRVELRPDGEHGKRFPIRRWLEEDGFQLGATEGSTDYCGVYDRLSCKLYVRSIPGDGDVFADLAGRRVVAECKGGVVNSKHAGQKSRLRRAVAEAVGQLLCRPLNGDDRSRWSRTLRKRVGGPNELRVERVPPALRSLSSVAMGASPTFKRLDAAPTVLPQSA